MASIDNMVLDDPIVGDGDISFTGGQVSASQESDIPKGAYASAQNMDFDQFGRLITRRGTKSTVGNVETRVWNLITTNWEALTTYWGSSLTTAAIDACYYYATYASNYVVVAQSGALKYATESVAFANIGSSSYSGNQVYFAGLNNRLYYCDGVGDLKYVDSSVAHSSISAGRVTSIKITSGGYGYTSVPAITFSSGAATATAILGYGGRVVGATITAGGSGYSASAPPTISFAAPPAAGTLATGRANISQTPSKPKFITAHTNRLFCSSADTAIAPDTLYASDFLDGESWDLVGASIRIGGDGDPITAIYSWINNSLLVFKQKSLYLVIADPLIDPSSWVIKLLSSRIGCVSHRSVQAVGADVFFLASDGVRSISQIEAGTVADIGLPLSYSVRDRMDTIGKSYHSLISSTYYNNRYILSIPDSTGAISGVLVWNQLAKTWSGFWTGWRPRDFCITGFGGRVRMNFADEIGRFWTWDDFTNLSAETSDSYLDDTMAYESYVITRGYNMGEPLVDKLGHTVHLFSDNRLTNAAQTCYAYYDMDASGSFTALDTAISISASDRQKRRTFNLLSKPKFNFVQFKFGATSGRAALSSVAVTGFADNIEPELSS